MEQITLSEYIECLQALEREHGGMLLVQKWMPAKGRHDAPLPKLAYARKFERGGVPAFYNPAHDNEVQKGDPVIRV